MFNSFRGQLISLLLGLLSLMTIAIGFATLSAMKRDSETQALRALNVASKVFQQALSNRATQLSTSVRIVASDFGFRQAVALREQETIATVLDNYGTRIDADISILLSPNGELLASTAQQLDTSQIAELNRDMKKAANEGFTDIVHLGNQAYQLVMVPVKAPQLIAWVGMGFALDQKLALGIKGITELDISFVFQTENAGITLLNSTLNTEDFAELAVSAQDPWLFTSGQGEMLSTSRVLDHSGKILAWLHLPTSRWQQSYSEARSQLIVIFGAGLTLALLLALILARNISRPLQRLSQFARDIGRGLQVAAPAVGRGEFGLLSQTLQKMQQDISAREQDIVYQSQHDSLTGLANRTLVEAQLPAFLQAQDLQLLLVNIKDFKHVNDAFGYSNGDLLLQQLGTRLTELPLPLAMVARLGGDEFLLAINEMLDERQVLQLQQQLSSEFQLGESRLNLKVALATVFCPKQSISSDDALRRVDIAMVHAKTSNQLWASYQQGQDESHQRELMLLHDLPYSLQSGQMFVVYQPKVAIQQPRARSAEALIRWQHPSLGFIPPDEFIRLADHSGLISQVTDWMIEQVISQLANWSAAGFDFNVAVNLSAYDLLNPDLPQQLSQLLTKYQVAGSALALEVTEGAVMQDPQQVIRNLQQLRSMGIELAIDDFGTGQSSLAYLKQLPVHEVKIDRAFVKDIEHNQNDELIVLATTQLAHGLGLRVTAEGLENEAGLAKLLVAGVDKVQGYYFARPLKADLFLAWMQAFPTEKTTWFKET